MVSGSQKLISAAAPAHECALRAPGGRRRPSRKGRVFVQERQFLLGWQRGHLDGALARGGTVHKGTSGGMGLDISKKPPGK